MYETDPITVEVIRHHLLSAAREMNRNLIRTSYNTIVYEMRDFGLGIYDKDCRLLAEAPGLAIFTRANDYALKKMVEFLGRDNIHPGDVIILNYPFWSSTHTLDVTATSPIFHHGELMGFTAVKIHWLDLDQKDPGYCLDTTDMHQEGLFFPCSKIYNRGILNQELVNIIRFNSRMPERVIGDMNAQISSCRTGERRVEALLTKFGATTFKAATEQILDHGERLALARLRSLPNGTWTAEDWVDDDGVDRDIMLKIKATVTITDSEMLLDFSGSSLAVKGPVNIPIGLTMGVGALIFKAITTPETPANEGNFRPLRVSAPEGGLMHAMPPSATFTLWPAVLATEVVTKALANGMPEIVPACSGGDLCTVMTVGTDRRTGKQWVEANNEGIGFGGHATGDGEHGIMHLTEPGCQNVPIEVVESKTPMLIEHYGLRQDSGGPGEHPGGLGITRSYKFLSEAAALTLVKKTKTRPWGIGKGHAGENSHVILRPGTASEERTGMVYEQMKPGEVLTNCSGGGGGWGDPLDRDPEMVLRDVVDEYVSNESALNHYGVVIETASMTVNRQATESLRKRKRGSAF